MVPKLIIFDCDGVLVDSEIIANRILSKLLREYNYNISATDLQQRFLGLSMSKIIEMVESEGITLPKDFQIVLRRRDKIAFKNELKPEYLGRGGAWLDAGSIKDLYDTSAFVSAIENRQGLKIACLEEIAFNNNWISKSKLIEAIKFYGNCEYSKYLHSLIKRK